MHKNNYTRWPTKIYMYVVQMHIKSEVKSFEVRVYQGFTRFSELYGPYGLIYAYLKPNTFYQPTLRPEFATAG